METAVEKLNVLLCKADSELTSLECKVDQEYSALASATGSQAKVSPTDLAKNVQQLRKELKSVSTDILELQNQQKQIMTTVLSQLNSLCSQFDELNGIVGPVMEKE
ncbi:uncharacterized protein LOC143026542 [Oratosquilla oratoria]|uniref:uncharacterized protein LOC143026542 n=1 Tax=Oratosquilla oratoria TaxID=337810 RepID=UPI003F7734C5